MEKLVKQEGTGLAVNRNSQTVCTSADVAERKVFDNENLNVYSINTYGTWRPSLVYSECSLY